jgi:hypothetical protein
MSIESRIAEWLKQPGTAVTPAEREFITLFRAAAANGVGYGWMQQVIEWEWQESMQKHYGLDVGALGPEYFQKELRALEAKVLSPEMIDTIIDGLNEAIGELRWGEGYGTNAAAQRGAALADKYEAAVKHLQTLK